MHRNPYPVYIPKMNRLKKNSRKQCHLQQSQEIKHLEIILTKKIKKLFNEKYKSLKKENFGRYKDNRVNGSAKSIL
jgi:hypothetical protein